MFPKFFKSYTFLLCFLLPACATLNPLFDLDDDDSSDGATDGDMSPTDSSASTGIADETSLNPDGTGDGPTSASTGDSGDSSSESTGDTGEEDLCGNEVVEDDEACDNGPENDLTAACLPDCTEASCGDENLHEGVEACDNGPENDLTAACLPDCTEAFCGDGNLHEGVEVCDPGMDSLIEGCHDSCAYAVCDSVFAFTNFIPGGTEAEVLACQTCLDPDPEVEILSDDSCCEEAEACMADVSGDCYNFTACLLSGDTSLTNCIANTLGGDLKHPAVETGQFLRNCSSKNTNCDSVCQYGVIPDPL